MNLLPCSCGAQVANDGGVDHPVSGAAPPCWTRFDALLARAEQDCPGRVAEMKAAYVVQHAETARPEVVAAALAQLGLARRTRKQRARTIFDVPVRGPVSAFVSGVRDWLDAVSRE